MSQSQKRPGTRDISELKARLGLNKQGSAGAKGGAAPSGPGAQRSIPAPPGAKPPQPDPSQDPFGAMNAMARGQAEHQAPPSTEYVVVHDNQQAEPVSQGKRATRIGILAAIAIVPLIIGVVVGQISTNANAYNQSIQDAELVQDDLRTIGRGLESVYNVLLVGKRGPGDTFLPHDEDLVDELDAVEAVRPNPEVVYNSYLFELEPRVVEDLFAFYTETRVFYDDLENHIRRSRNDADLLERSDSELADITHLSYGVFVEIPENGSGPEALPHAEVVELGNPVCEGASPGSPCATPDAFQYRPDPSGPWGQMDISDPADPQVAEREIFLLDQNPLFEGLVAGSEERLATQAYLNRLADLEEKIEDLMERRSRVQELIGSWANESPRFTFFL